MGGKFWILTPRFPVSPFRRLYPSPYIPAEPGSAWHKWSDGVGWTGKKKKIVYQPRSHVMFERKRSGGFPSEEMPHHPQHWPMLSALVQGLAGGWWGSGR